MPRNTKARYGDGRQPLASGRSAARSKAGDASSAEGSQSSAPQLASDQAEGQHGKDAPPAVSTVLPTDDSVFKKPGLPASSTAAQFSRGGRKSTLVTPEPENFGPALALAADLRRRKEAPTAEDSTPKRAKATPTPSPSGNRRASKSTPKSTPKGNRSTTKKPGNPSKVRPEVQEVAPPAAKSLWLLPAWDTPPIETMIEIQRRNSSAQKSKSRKDIGDVLEIVNFPVWKPTDAAGEAFLKSLTISDPLMENCIPNSNILLHRSDNVPCQKKIGREYYNQLGYSFWWDQNTMSVDGPEAKEVKINWDHYTGLVRITDMFYCCRPGKAEPNIAITKTPGLKDLCANVTGGRLDLQGYWVPFHAARAIAAHLCWPIRFQLAPIFGPMFPYHCVSPHESGFHQFRVNDHVMERVRAVSLSLEREAGKSVRAIVDGMELTTPDEEKLPSSPLSALITSSNTSAGEEEVAAVEGTGKKVALSLGSGGAAEVSPAILEMKKAEEVRPLAQNTGKYQVLPAGVLYADEVPAYQEAVEEDEDAANAAAAIMMMLRLGGRAVHF